VAGGACGTTRNVLAATGTGVGSPSRILTIWSISTWSKVWTVPLAGHVILIERIESAFPNPITC